MTYAAYETAEYANWKEMNRNEKKRKRIVSKEPGGSYHKTGRFVS